MKTNYRHRDNYENQSTESTMRVSVLIFTKICINLHSVLYLRKKNEKNEVSAKKRQH